MTAILLLTIVLAFAWAVMSGSFIVPNLIFGFVLASFALWLIRDHHGQIGIIGRAFRIVNLMRIFVFELVMSSVRVAGLALRPKLDFKSATIAYPLSVDTDFEISCLANLVTLTPGTLSVDVSDDRKTLYIHCIDAPDPDAIIDDIKTAFERKIMEAFR